MSWRTARSLDALTAEVRARWPGSTVWTIGDTAHAARASDHNPNGAGVVCAADYVGLAQAAAVVATIERERDPRLAYVINRGQIMAGPAGPSPWVWRPYSGRNPHDTHAHVSVGRGGEGRKGRPDLYDDPAPWGLASQPADRQEDDVYVIRSGDTGARVTRVQRILHAVGTVEGLGDLLPAYGVDGDYGGETAAAIDTLASRAKLDREGSTGCDVLLLDWCRMVLEAARSRSYAAEVGGVDVAELDERYLQRGDRVTLD